MTINVTNGTLTSVSGALHAYSNEFLPETIAVTGASSTYNPLTGAYALSSPTSSTIGMTAVGEWAFNCTVSQLSGYSTLSGGSHTLQVRALASGYAPGELSEAVSFEVPYSVSYNLTGCSVTSQGTGTSSSLLYEDVPLVIDISVNNNFALPDSVTVSGASYTYSKANSTLTLSNPTGPVSVIITCVSTAVGYIVDVTCPGQSEDLSGDFYDGENTSAPYLGSGTGSYVCNSGKLRFVAYDGYDEETSFADLDVDEVSAGITYTSASNPTGYIFTVTSDGWIAMHDGYHQCFVKGTPITLADGSTKLVEDISYDDDLLVWDFDNGQFASAKPLWIKKKKACRNVDCSIFSDGTEIQFVDDHRIFNMQAGKFTYLMTDETPIGTLTINDKGQYLSLVAKYSTPVDTDFYNIVTAYHMNVFAGHVLTSCRLSNLYPISNMRYIPDGRTLRDPSEFSDIPSEYVSGLRLLEQLDPSQEEHDHRRLTLKEYVKRLLYFAKPKEESE